MVKVSVIIPCYNAEKYLEACLGSLLSQTLHEMEFIFVDDGSTRDDTAAILDSFPERDARIRVIHQENRGPGGARNSGIRAACGEYVGFVDTDDTIPENYYETMYSAASRHDADVAWTSILRLSSGRPTHYTVHFREEIEYGPGDERLINRSNHSVNKIYRRSLFDDGSLLFREGCFYEDMIFTLPVMFAAKKVVTVPGIEYRYNYVPSSVTHRRQDPRLQEDRYRALLFQRRFLEEHGFRIPRRLRQIRRKDYGIGRFSFIKVKDCGDHDVVKLFDLIPIWFISHRKQDDRCAR